MDKLNKKKIKMVNKELYHVQELKQFHKMPIVKVMLFNSDDIVKILNGEILRIGKSRAAKCRNKNDTSKYKCILCRNKHPSDSLQCELYFEGRNKDKDTKKRIFFYSDKKSFLLVENFHILILRFCARSDIYKITNEIPKVNSRNKIIITRKNVEQKNGNSSNIHMIFFNNKCLNLFFVL
ncbi:hypothetical protein RFI_24238, partial [Reticulomyxa filosa]